jgi:hypothetical protein
MAIMTLCPHLLRRKDAEKSDGTITHDDYGRSFLHVGGISSEPPCAEYIRSGQQAG